MKYSIYSLLLFLCITSYGFSQDIIYRTNGDKIFCKILSEDSLHVYFTKNENGKTINTSITKTDIKLIDYNSNLQGKEPITEHFSIGLGLGMDYGGIGGNILIYPAPRMGLFVGAGYALAGLGYNAGFKVKLKKKGTSPFILGMYGYNSAIKVVNASEYNKFFYGFTFGVGIDFRSKPWKKGYWTLGLLIPVRNQDVFNYMDNLKDNHGISYSNELIPIGITIGYRFIN